MNKKHAGLILIAAVSLALIVATGKKPPITLQNIQIEPTLQESIIQQLSQKHSKPESNISIQVSNQTGGHAKGTVQFTDEMGGGLWFAAKTNNGWEVAFDGNGIVACDIVERYEFPREMIPNCVNGEELVTR
jgi:hypothetical protein